MMGEEALEATHFKKKKLTKEKVDDTKTENKSEELEKENSINHMCKSALKEHMENYFITLENSDNEEEEEDLWKVNINIGFKKGDATEKEDVKKEKDKKDIICRHFKKARCHHGMSERQKHNSVAKCPYKHPTNCPKRLRHGDRGKGRLQGEGVRLHRLPPS